METPMTKYVSLLGDKDIVGTNPTVFSKTGFIVETEEQAWNFFNIIEKDRGIYFELKLIPYSGKKIVGSKVKKIVGYR
jgi:hypothetical protein